jgi:nucleotide-binding universal stress UspA family protein
MLFGVRPRKRVIPSQFRRLSQKIIRQADVPVMLVRDECQSLEKILVCSGGQEISAPVVELSSKLAGRAGLKATLLTVSPSVPSMYTGMAEIEETMEELLETETPMAQHLRASAELLTGRGIEAEIEIQHGDVVEAILEEANVGGYDLIVLGAAEGMTWRGLLLGNVTQQIINRAASAVLVVKK